MKGWLVVNGFLQSAKFQQLYELLQNSAKQLNICLQMRTSDSFVVDEDALQREKPDFVLFWDKDIHLAKRLERQGLRLFNNAHALEICDSKVLTALALQDVVPMPKTVFAPKTFEGVGYGNLQFVDKAVDLLGLPVVIKEAYGSFGRQVYLAKTLEDARRIATQLAGKDFLLQQFVAESSGRDVRVNVVGGKVVNAILRTSGTDFRSNLTLGGSMSPYNLTQEQIDLAQKACRALKLDFAGVDVLFGNDGPILCEVNSNPHFKTTLDCTGVDLSKNILQHVVDVLQRETQ